MKKIAFTICSNNYLAQAKTLVDSLIKYNPDYTFHICLVDKKIDGIDYLNFSPAEVNTIDSIGLADINDLRKKYNIIEFNTAVKASFFKYLFSRYTGAEFIIYFDPDISIFNNLSSIENEFSTSDILLTPHILKPINPDGKIPGENSFLNFGIYNLGFIGIKNTENTFQFLNWWEERLMKLSYMDVANGIYVDQLLINLVPIFFKKVKILLQMGYNVAPWNLHERNYVQKIDHYYVMEDKSYLTFFHFSGYNYLNPGKLSKYERSDFSNAASYLPIYSAYHDALIANGIDFYSKIKCFYSDQRFPKLQRKIKKALTELLPPIVLKKILFRKNKKRL